MDDKNDEVARLSTIGQACSYARDGVAHEGICERRGGIHKVRGCREEQGN